MSFSDTVFIFFLALIVFGPKKLPEMARQAGRLLAELRRASNEFKSQIETEIAHLEVQKRDEQREEQKKQSELAPAPASSGNVASLSVHPAVGETIPHNTESTATLAAPAAEVTSPNPSGVPNASSVSSAESVEPSDSTSQASHV
jgi:sec-independent protein translocase protein TatB